MIKKKWKIRICFFLFFRKLCSASSLRWTVALEIIKLWPSLYTTKLLKEHIICCQNLDLKNIFRERISNGSIYKSFEIQHNDKSKISIFIVQTNSIDLLSLVPSPPNFQILRFQWGLRQTHVVRPLHLNHSAGYKILIKNLNLQCPLPFKFYPTHLVALSVKM